MPMAVTPDPPPKREHRSGCDTKAQYTRKRALAIVDEMAAKTGDDGLTAYHCERHHCWHIGHEPGTGAGPPEREHRLPDADALRRKRPQPDRRPRRRRRRRR